MIGALRGDHALVESARGAELRPGGGRTMPRSHKHGDDRRVIGRGELLQDSRSSRERISCAARRVNVIARISPGALPSSSSRTMRRPATRSCRCRRKLRPRARARIAGAPREFALRRSGSRRPGSRSRRCPGTTPPPAHLLRRRPVVAPAQAAHLAVSHAARCPIAGSGAPAAMRAGQPRSARPTWSHQRHELRQRRDRLHAAAALRRHGRMRGTTRSSCRPACEQQPIERQLHVFAGIAQRARQRRRRARLVVDHLQSLRRALHVDPVDATAEFYLVPSASTRCAIGSLAASHRHPSRHAAQSTPT